jgi:large subunit ribosomal protein L11
MRLAGGAATAAPPVGSSLGQHQVNLMDFCKKFNERTSDRKGSVVAVEVTVFVDKTYIFTTKLTSVSDAIKKRINLAKGSSLPGKTSCGTISRSIIEELAKAKMADLTAVDLAGAMKIVEGSAKSMGLVVVD